MTASIAGFSVNVIDAGWCNELHQSTDFLMIGIWTNPIIERYANNLSALSKLLNEQNIAHIITREPGGTESGEQIRKILLQGNTNKLDSYSEFLCFSASRREHLKKVILPALSQNKIVICDRFLDSSIVYQGMVGGLDEEIILKSVSKTGCIVSAEEHNYLGGLGESISRLLSLNNPTPQEFIATQDTFGESGTPAQLMEKYGLNSENIIKKVKSVIKRK